MNKLYISAITLGLVAGLFLLSPTSAQTSTEALPLPAAVLCGGGFAADDYGFTYPLEQYHWTVGWEPYMREDIVDRVDVILGGLDNDNIAQTMILIKSAEEVGNRVNCAVHFLRYMELGLVEGERKDNGFVFLIVVEEDDIDVHYGVGLGLPALTAQGLTPLNRLAEDTCEETGSISEALLTLVNAFDEYARSKYDPWYPPAATSNPQSSIPLTLPPLSGTLLFCIICLACLAFLFLFFIFSRIVRWLGRIGGGTGGRRRRWGTGPSVTIRPPRWSGSSRPKPRIRLPRRRGGGSGRSHRGN